MNFLNKTILIFLIILPLLLGTQCGIIGSKDDAELVGHWLRVQSMRRPSGDIFTRDNAEYEWFLEFTSDSMVYSSDNIEGTFNHRSRGSRFAVLYERTWSESDSADVIYMLDDRFILEIEGNILTLTQLCSSCYTITFVRVYDLSSK